MKVAIEFDPINEDPKLIAFRLRAIADSLSPQTFVTGPGKTAPINTDDEVKAVFTDEAKQEEPKKEKPAKAKAKKLEPVPTPAQEEEDPTGEDEDIFAEEMIKAPAPPPAPAPVAKVTKETLINSFKEFCGKHGNPKALELMKKFGAANISQLKETDYFSVLESLKGHG